MIEAMAWGTLVIAFRHGSVMEIIQNGLTGFVVSSVEEAVTAVKHLELPDRRLCRKTFEERFSSEPMAREYLTVYDCVPRRGRFYSRNR